MVKLKSKDKELKENPEQKTTEVKSEIKVDTNSDTFTAEERKDIIKIVSDDVKFGEEIQKNYITQKELDLKHYHCVKPSELEGLTKKGWMSDRNLGLARAVGDSYQSTLLATAWNPDSINFVATRSNDIDNRNNQEKFTKWGMGKQEANAFPEVDGFIHNRIVVGTSFFKIYRRIWEEWIDKRIPVKNKRGETYKYEIKTEKVRLEKGVIENVPDIDDILMPEYGKDIQDLSFFIQVLHLDGEKVLNYINRKVFIPQDKEKYKEKLKNHAYSDKVRVLGEEKLKAMGMTSSSMTDLDVRRLSITLYEWYGFYTKNGRTEKFRFIVDIQNEEFLGGKPLRKINRSGKIPFVGRGLCNEPGHIRGISLMQIIAPVINAFNCVFNQKSDFQYVTNCPFGFYTPAEGYTKAEYELEPLVMYPVDDPSKVNIPNIQRSMAWAESDLRILFEVLERLTGAASYFSSRGNQSKTLGQDQLIQQNSETRFGLWESRIRADICEAIAMWFELYQDYPPKGLSERILGEDGKKIFPNLSIDSLRGDTTVQMQPDIVAGSKAYRKQLQMGMFQIGQSMLWLNPQVNPSGNYNLCADTLKELGNLSDNDVIRYLGEKPKSKFNESELNNEWYDFMNGKDFDPPEGETALALQHLEGHTLQKEEKYHELAEEYRPNFDAHYFKTMINAMKFIKGVQQEQMANKLASQAIMQGGGQQGGNMPVQPVNAQPEAPVGQGEAIPRANEQPSGALPGGIT
ncbi:MAG: hypothetical protein PHY56_00835 [Candidatus Omnitrophica bacterium]|nr:hypothetical protein [Candidatus Omnitrophota bacterium]